MNENWCSSIRPINYFRRPGHLTQAKCRRLKSKRVAQQIVTKFNQRQQLFRRDNLNGTYHRTELVLKETGFDAISHEDILIVQYVAAIVSQRAALLVAIPTAVLLRRMSRKDVTIAIDGSVYKHHPRMDGWLNRIIRTLVSDDKIVSKMTCALRNG